LKRGNVFLYFIPVIAAFLVALFLIWLLFPSEGYSKAMILVVIPLVILAIGFRIITYQRIQIIRNQLYQIIQTLEEFDIEEPGKIIFEASPFLIFNEINEYLKELLDRVRKDYQANKQFTQNASHELQTPLAVIKGHVELLIQSPNMGEAEIDALAVVLQNTNRLSKLNSALILLSKIEHQQFIDTSTVDFRDATNEVLQNFHDLIDIQGIAIRKEYAAAFQVEMSTTLAEILIANLVQNAIRHNLEHGYIKIVIQEDSYSISNPGRPLSVKTALLFNRFQKESNTEKSLGLGLSIVKRICEQSNLEITYTYNEGIHTLTLCRKEN
jgi:signal transduction histidine kinase